MKDTPLSIRLEPEMRQALTAIAEAEDRPVSRLIRKILTDWLRKQQARGAK